jgi:hypothetical protein
MSGFRSPNKYQQPFRKTNYSHDVLLEKFNESAINGDPLVAVFDNEISGRDPSYLNAYRKFIDYAVSKKATFGTTSKHIKRNKASKHIY